MPESLQKRTQRTSSFEEEMRQSKDVTSARDLIAKAEDNQVTLGV